MEDKVPAHILAQVHALAMQGISVQRISFLLRLDEDTIDAELRNPTMRVNTTEHGGEGEKEPESPSER
jgi:hypothetical protein